MDTPVFSFYNQTLGTKVAPVVFKRPGLLSPYSYFCLNSYVVY